MRRRYSGAALKHPPAKPGRQLNTRATLGFSGGVGDGAQQMAFASAVVSAKNKAKGLGAPTFGHFPGSRHDKIIFVIIMEIGESIVGRLVRGERGDMRRDPVTTLIHVIKYLETSGWESLRQQIFKGGAQTGLEPAFKIFMDKSDIQIAVFNAQLQAVQPLIGVARGCQGAAQGGL